MRDANGCRSRAGKRATSWIVIARRGRTLALAVEPLRNATQKLGFLFELCRYVCCSAYIDCSWTILDRATLKVRHMSSYDELLGDSWGYAAVQISGEQPAWYLGISYALLSLDIAFLSCAFLQVFPLYSSPCLSFLAPVQPPCSPRHAKTVLPSA
jgi:hypothetical protein